MNTKKTFPDLLGENNGLLSCDFYLTDMNMLFELHGLQHYKPIEWFGGLKTFETQLKHDGVKEQFAKENNYILHVIPTNRITKKNLYLELKKIFSINEI